jgi:hypothetical protein
MDIIGDGSENYLSPIYNPQDNVRVIGEHCLVPALRKTCPLLLAILGRQKK